MRKTLWQLCACWTLVEKNPSNGFSSQVDSGDEALSTAALTAIILIPRRLFPFNTLFRLDRERREQHKMLLVVVLQRTYEHTCPDTRQQVNPETEHEIHVQTSMKNQMKPRQEHVCQRRDEHPNPCTLMCQSKLQPDDSTIFAD